ncbi:MAG: sulfatase [Acidobacteria bacterium]|nr:sulfatase [Acidobacteriota bacterium]
MKRSPSRAAKVLPALAAFALAALGGLWQWNRPRIPPRPDIFLITVDTLRADRLGSYGYGPARTPALDRLASEGTVFLQATTPFPRTTPGLASLLTGLWPLHHGSREVAQPLGEVTTLAEILKARGYVTLAASANGAASPHQKIDRGFDRFLDYRDLVPPIAEAVTAKTLERVREVPAEEPLFLWMHTIDPHFPYTPPASWKDQPEAPECRRLMTELATDRWKIGEVQVDRNGVASAVLEECSALYDAEIAYTDAEIGRFLEGLRAARRRPALILFTSDHGENLGEAGLFFEHGPSVHDASLRVPLILVGDGIPARMDSDPVRLEDVVPTLLDLLGIPAKGRPAFDGVSFAHRLRPWRLPPPLRGRVPTALAESGTSLLPNTFRWPFSGRAQDLHCLNSPELSLCTKPGEEPRLYRPADDPRLEHDLREELPQEYQVLLEASERWVPEQVRERTLRTHRFKLVEYPLWRGGYRSALYDLETDPGETRDVKALFPSQFQDLSRRLGRFTALLPASGGDERTEEQLEALRALGYVQ